MFLIWGKYSAFFPFDCNQLFFFTLQRMLFCFFKPLEVDTLFCATKVGRYFKNTVSLARKIIEMLKRVYFAFVFLLISSYSQAQKEGSAFHFLQLPSSAHGAALGGENISIIEDDLSLSIHNPALLSCVSDKSLLLNYMYYIKGVNVAGAAFTRTAGQRGNWAVAAQYIDYGKMKETTAENVTLGTFSAKDISLSGIYAYALSDFWSGGVRANLIYSHYDSYSSVAIGIDLGLNYYREESDFSASIVGKNLGGQLKSFEERHEKLPAELQMGFSKGLSHAPFRLSLTLHDLTRWSDADTSANNFRRKLLNHMAVGVDFLPTDNIYLAVGYNFRRGDEMKVAGSSHWAGFTAGAGVHIKRLKIDAAYLKQHFSASSLLLNLAYAL